MSALDDLIARDAGAKAPSGLDALIAKESAAPAPQGQAPASPAPKGTAQPISTAERVGAGLADPIYGAQQLLIHALPESVIQYANKVSDKLNTVPYLGEALQKMGLGKVPTAPEIDATLKNREQVYQSRRQQAGSDGVDLARGVGNVISSLPFAAAAPASSTMAGSALSGGVTNALTAALSPVTEGNYADEKLMQVGGAAALGAGLGAAGSGLASVIAPKVSKHVQTLMNEGVTPTPGQILGGGMAALEAKATSVPVLGDVIKKSQDRALTQFNEAAYNRALSPIGEKITSAPGRDAIEEIANKLGSAYESLLPKLSFKADAQFNQELGTISQMAQTLAPQQANRFEQILKDVVVNKMTTQGNMSGTSLKAVESDLGRLAKLYKGDASTDGRLLGDALASVQDSLRNSLARTNPGHAKELQAINTGYANFARIRDAASRVGTDEGVFTASQLQGAIRAGDKSVGKGSFAKGNALMQDLSEAGTSVLSPKYKDSGTAGRLLAAGLLGHAAVVNPMSIAGVAAAAAPYTDLGGRLAAKALTSRPAGAKQVAESIRKISPYLGLSALPLLPN